MKFIEAVQKFFGAFADAFAEPPILQKLFTSQTKKDMLASLDIIYNIGEKEIEEKLKGFKGDQLNEESLKQFIPYLYHVKEMSVADIKVDILSILMASVETVSFVLSPFSSLLCFVCKFQQ